MNKEEIARYIDHTLLKAASSWDEIRNICNEAIEYRVASVCIPPSYVERVRETYPELCITTVIGFPLGYSTTATKTFEVKDAVRNGADEVDIVINVGWVKNKQFDLIQAEIREAREASKNAVLKVIIETCYLSNNDKTLLCKIITDENVDYIKTSTGFGSAGATHEDVQLLKRKIGPNVKIKAAGGIKTINDFLQYVEEGCERIGTSSTRNFLDSCI